MNAGVPLIMGIGLLGLVALAILVVVLVVAATRRRANPVQDADEARLMQEIYQGLQRLEQRIEVLETILIDREKQRQAQNANGRDAAEANDHAST